MGKTYVILARALRFNCSIVLEEMTKYFVSGAVFLFLIELSAGYMTCGYGWDRLPGGKFCLVGGTQTTFQQSQQICGQWGGFVMQPQERYDFTNPDGMYGGRIYGFKKVKIGYWVGIVNNSTTWKYAIPGGSEAGQIVNSTEMIPYTKQTETDASPDCAYHIPNAFDPLIEASPCDAKRHIICQKLVKRLI